jgi:hypothetical protein
MWVKDKVKMTFFVQEQVNVVEWCMSSCVHIFVMSKKNRSIVINHSPGGTKSKSVNWMQMQKCAIFLIENVVYFLKTN